MKIVSVIGARPQFVKAAVVSRCLREVADELVIHTGQHYDENMSEVFFREMGIAPPDYNLAVGSGRHGTQTAKMLTGIEEILCDVSPDWVLVYGDTNSTIAGALAATKLQIPVAHVEAGLRSFNRAMPEEINRILTDHASDLLLAPTQTAVKHLRSEGVAESKVHCVGDVMFDAVLHYKQQAADESRVLSTLGLEDQPYVLATIHRAENTDNEGRLRAIFAGLSEVNREMPVVLPLHPRTKHRLQSIGQLEDVGREIHLIDPVGYLDMLALQSRAKLVATDSGGVQKEAFFCGTPCVTLRDETEWVELVELGWNTLVSPTNADEVASRTIEALEKAYLETAAEQAPFGRGNAGEQIVAALTRQESSHEVEEAAAQLAS